MRVSVFKNVGEDLKLRKQMFDDMAKGSYLRKRTPKCGYEYLYGAIE